MSWAEATHVRCRRPTETRVLYETTQHDEIAALARALEVEPAHGAYCMCIGTLVFKIDGANITLHHGESLRWEGSGGNAQLATPDAIMDWLSARGMPFVREEYEAAKTRADEGAIEAERWIAAMPSSLVPFFEDMRQSGSSSEPEWTAAIEAQIPDRVERTRVMLDLYGSGVGRWSGYPSWETVPMQLVAMLPFEILIAAIGDAPPERTCAGAVRLICSWDFRKRRKKLVAKLSDAVRRRLLEHAQTLPDGQLETAVDCLAS